MQLIIPAAGHNSRFGGHKFEAKVGDETVLQRNVRLADGMFSEILLLLPPAAYDVVDLEGVTEVCVDRGTGSAGALREIVDKISDDDVAILWSDTVIVSDKTYIELFSNQFPDHTSGLAPSVPEVRPYCHLEVGKSNDILYGSYDRPTVGLHDQGIFKFRGEWLKHALRSTSYSNLIDLFAWFSALGLPVRTYRTNYPTLGFNDEAKLAQINALLA